MKKLFVLALVLLFATNISLAATFTPSSDVLSYSIKGDDEGGRVTVTTAFSWADNTVLGTLTFDDEKCGPYIAHVAGSPYPLVGEENSTGFIVSSDQSLLSHGMTYTFTWVIHNYVKKDGGGDVPSEPGPDPL